MGEKKGGLICYRGDVRRTAPIRLPGSRESMDFWPTDSDIDLPLRGKSLRDDSKQTGRRTKSRAAEDVREDTSDR